MRAWIRQPLAILAEHAGGGLVVEDGRIAELVATGRQPAQPVDTTFDASRHVVIPGLINGHHHFFQTLTRAHPAAINRKLFDWLNALYPLWAAHVNPQAFRQATRLALTELIMSGCTCASDHQYLYPAGLEDAMDVQAEEASRLGIRMTLTRGSMDLSQKDGGLPPDNVVQGEDAILADCERVIARYHDRRPGAMLQVALAPCAPFTVSKQLMVDTARLAERHGVRLHTHLAETREENAYCLAHHNGRPLDYLEECGWLSDRVWLAHGVHFNDSEIERLGRNRVGICHCPTSNMLLASGQCRTAELEAAGCHVGLGVDGSASNDSSNLMEGLRHALLLNRITYDETRVTHLDTYRWATAGSAACLGRQDIGRIAVGCEADLALFTLDELRFSGAGDPLAALVICGAHSADRVMVKGEWRVIDGMPAGIDVARLRAEHGAAARAFLSSV